LYYHLRIMIPIKIVNSGDTEEIKNVRHKNP